MTRDEANVYDGAHEEERLLAARRPPSAPKHEDRDRRDRPRHPLLGTAARAKAVRDVAAIMASFRGDRRKIAKERGAPADLPYAAMARAPKWTYNDNVAMDQVAVNGANGSTATATRTAPCTVTFTFRGDKQINVAKVGAGCVND